MESPSDAQELGQLGYAQELFRSMGGFSNFALSFSIVSITTGIVQLFDYGLAQGGPAEMALGWPLVCFFTCFVALSMAELASAFPTSGAMYHWSARLGGPGWGWLTAWLNIVGLITIIAAVDYGCAQFLVPLLGFTATQTTVVVAAGLVMLSHATINHFGIKLVAWLNEFSVTVHILGVAVIVGALSLFAPHQPLSYFFTRASTVHTVPYWWAFIIGLLQAQWTMAGYDGSAQVSEETVDPRIRVPWGIVISVLVSSVFGYLLLFALTLAIRDIPHVLNAGVPAVIAILDTALGERAGSIVTAFAVATMWFCGLSAVTAVSRTIYAFARDEGMPMSATWRHVSPRFGTPGHAIWLAIAAAFATIVYSPAFSVVTSMSVLSIYLAYITPIFLNWREVRCGRTGLRGPWSLGRWSHLVQSLALLWTAFIAVILVLPPNQNAGYAIAVTLVLLAVVWVNRERHRFRGPHWIAEAAPEELVA
ncbi:MAG: amino acid permease [Candidatus Xenobia bacterium]